MSPSQINPAQWQHALTIARQTCARIFRDGGEPSDAMEAFGLAGQDCNANWRQAVETIAWALCATPVRRVA
ncbi:MAG: hypothetical protein AAFW82_09560 [Pseudomonadota bacterium]